MRDLALPVIDGRQNGTLTGGGARVHERRVGRDEVFHLVEITRFDRVLERVAG